MANAKKCDVCRCFYSGNIDNVFNVAGIKVVRYRYEDKYYDVCEDCYNKVKEALGLKEEYRNSKK